MIRAENSGDKAGVDRIISSYGSENTYTAKLRSKGRLIPELSLVYETDGCIKGYIGCTAARAGELDTPFITGIHAENDDIKEALVSQLICSAKEKGCDALLVYNDVLPDSKELGFYSSVCFGIIPPESFDDIGVLHCVCLSEKRLSEAVRAELPEELGKTFVDPVFEIHSRLSEAEYEFTAMDTRRRSRIINYIIESAMIILSVILFFIKKRFFFLSPAIIIAFYMIKTFSRLKKFKEDMVKSRKNDGKPAIDEYLVFYDSDLMVYLPQSSDVYLRKYTDYHFMFLKKDYMMIGYPAKDNNMNGNTIKYRDIPDKEALIRFIKEKSGGIRVMK